MNFYFTKNNRYEPVKQGTGLWFRFNITSEESVKRKAREMMKDSQSNQNVDLLSMLGYYDR